MAGRPDLGSASDWKDFNLRRRKNIYNVQTFSNKLWTNSVSKFSSEMLPETHLIYTSLGQHQRLAKLLC